MIVPGSYICGDEDLEDVGLELGEVFEPLSLHYTKAVKIIIHEEKSPDILDVLFTVRLDAAYIPASSWSVRRWQEI